MTLVPLHLSLICFPPQFHYGNHWQHPATNKIECIILICGRRRTGHHLYRSVAHHSDELLTRQKWKKKKIKKYKRKEQKKNEREMIDSSRKQQQQQKKKNKKSCVIGTDLDRRWCRRRWFRKEPIGRRWLYPFVGPRKCRIIKLTTYQQHWRERRHWRCWPLTERRTVCAAAAVASIRAIATYSS